MRGGRNGMYALSGGQINSVMARRPASELDLILHLGTVFCENCRFPVKKSTTYGTVIQALTVLSWWAGPHSAGTDPGLGSTKCLGVNRRYRRAGVAASHAGAQ